MDAPAPPPPDRDARDDAGDVADGAGDAGDAGDAADPADAAADAGADEFGDLIATDGPERGAIARVALVVAAVVFVALGIAGWLIPIMSGVPFYVLALICLGMANRRVAKWVNQRERRLPQRWRRWLRPGRRRHR